MAKSTIKNYQDLMGEKERLINQLKTSKSNIRQSYGTLKEELNPFSVIKRTVKGAFPSHEASHLMQFSIKKSSDFLIKKILLKRAGWLHRLIIPFLVKEVTTQIVAKKADFKIAHMLRVAADKIRKTKALDCSRFNQNKK